MKGPNHEVREKAEITGPLLRFTIDSEFGEFEAIGIMMANRRIEEINAIAVMREESVYKEFTDELLESLYGPIEGLRLLFSDPIHSAESLYNSAELSINQTIISYNSERSNYEDTYMEGLLSVSKNKRDLAMALNVDVYSDNLVLQKELNRLAYARTEGGWTPSVITMPMGGLALSVVKGIGFVETLDTYLKQASPATLRHQVNEKLLEKGVSEELRLEFIGHSHLTPRNFSIIAACFLVISEAVNSHACLQAATEVVSYEEALFFQQVMEMMALYEKRIEHIQEVFIYEKYPVGLNQSGALLFAAPVDFIQWGPVTQQMVEYAKAKKELDSRVERLEFWTTGKLTPLALGELQKAGFIVKDSVRLPLDFVD